MGGCGLTVAIAAGALAAFSAAAEPLRPPFDAEVRRAVIGAPAPAFTCKAPPAAVHDLHFDGFYADKGSGSTVVDDDMMDAYRDARRPLDSFNAGVIGMGNAYIRAHPADPAIAACALAWLGAWADGGALTGTVSEQGGYNKKWTTGTLALAYIMVKPAAGEAARRAIEPWLRGLAEWVREEYSTGMERGSRRNNHATWAAWSVMAASVALDDRGLFDWGVAGYDRAIAHVQADGSLPLEMERRSKALHYHLFSIEPLVLMAETGARNGLDLYAARGGALHRLVRLAMAGLADREVFARLSGFKQDFVGKLSGSQLTWMVPYHARFGEAALVPWMRDFRPLRNTRSGGDFDLLYGAPPSR